MISVPFHWLYKIKLLLSVLLKRQVERVPSLAIRAHLLCFQAQATENLQWSIIKSPWVRKIGLFRMWPLPVVPDLTG